MAQQYSMKKAKELLGDKADAAVMRELNQINDFETYVPMKSGDLSWKEKKKALESLIFVTEKRNGDIGLQGGGWKQVSSAPMMATTSLMGRSRLWSLRAYSS